MAKYFLRFSEETFTVHSLCKIRSETTVSYSCITVIIIINTPKRSCCSYFGFAFGFSKTYPVKGKYVNAVMYEVDTAYYMTSVLFVKLRALVEFPGIPFRLLIVVAACDYAPDQVHNGYSNTLLLFRALFNRNICFTSNHFFTI